MAYMFPTVLFTFAYALHIAVQYVGIPEDAYPSTNFELVPVVTLINCQYDIVPALLKADDPPKQKDIAYNAEIDTLKSTSTL